MLRVRRWWGGLKSDNAFGDEIEAVLPESEDIPKESKVEESELESDDDVTNGARVVLPLEQPLASSTVRRPTRA